MRWIVVIFLSISILCAQSFSSLAVTEEKYLNFTSEKKNKLVYIDESSSLAWQNSIALISFSRKKDAKAYCRHLNFDGLSWSLPTSWEIKSLSMTQAIIFGHKLPYFVSNRPIWDKNLDYFYSTKASALKLISQNKELYVRCVSRLAE